MATTSPLHAFASNIHSQNGEDGIIEEILRRISNASQTDKWCVEFGAWDGMHLSNTYHLIKARGYKAVLIEGDKNKFQALCKNIPQQDVYKICRFVSLEGSATLDSILKETPIPHDFDFLSIDIDGCDYFIFDSLKDHQPKIVCIEYNPTIPNEVEFVQPRDFKVKQGASAKSLTMLASSKGYSLVAVTVTNLLFVRNDLYSSVLGSERGGLDSLRDDAQCKIFVFSGYDGTILSNKTHIPILWHGISPDLNAFQQLPKMLRRLPSDYNLLQKVAFALLRAVKNPAPLKGRINERFKKNL